MERKEEVMVKKCMCKGKVKQTEKHLKEDMKTFSKEKKEDKELLKKLKK